MDVFELIFFRPTEECLEDIAPFKSIMELVKNDKCVMILSARDITLINALLTDR